MTRNAEIVYAEVQRDSTWERGGSVPVFIVVAVLRSDWGDAVRHEVEFADQAGADRLLARVRAAGSVNLAHWREADHRFVGHH